MTSHGEIMNGTHACYPSRRNHHFSGPQRVTFKALADLPDESTDAETRLIWRQDVKRMLKLLDTIPPRECLAIRMRFGIGCEPHTLEQIANLYGTAKERPRQIILKGLDRLRFKLRIASQKDDPVAYDKLIKQRAADAKARADAEAERLRLLDLEIAERIERRQREARELHERVAAVQQREELNWRSAARKAELERGNPPMVELPHYRPRPFVIFRDGQWITVYWHH